MVFRTVDAAKHWLKQLTGQSQFCGFSPLAVQFFDQMHGFIKVRCPTEQLYRTTDGGAHWDSVAFPSPQVEVIAFSDPSNGWLLAQPTPEAASWRTSPSGTIAMSGSSCGKEPVQLQSIPIVEAVDE